MFRGFYSAISANFSLAPEALLLSGCHCLANLKYAFLISSLLAFLDNPRVSKVSKKYYY